MPANMPFLTQALAGGMPSMGGGYGRKLKGPRSLYGEDWGRDDGWRTGVGGGYQLDPLGSQTGNVGDVGGGIFDNGGLGSIGSALRESNPGVALDAYLGNMSLPPVLRRLLQQQLGSITNRYQTDISSQMMDPNATGGMGAIPSFQDWLRNRFSGMGFLEEMQPGVLSQGRFGGGTMRQRLI